MDWKHLLSLDFNQLGLSDEENEIIALLAQRMQDNYPYHIKEYAGQMIKPPHRLSQAAYWLSTFVNPNNHALDGGRASSALEIEVMDQFKAMVGWEQGLGHLTSGGTMGNLEALWVGRHALKGATVLASEAAHYTHSRMAEVLGMEFISVPCDIQGKMDIDALCEHLKSLKNEAIVVATLGTTGSGAVDPLCELLNLREKQYFRIHVDAAYGGYFGLSALPKDTLRHFEAIQHADSLVIDPHKHGLQPYGCGAVLLKDATEGRFYKHDSPYTYFTSDDLHLGELTLECSRSGSSAAALWATLQKFPLVKNGAFAQRLDESLAAAQGMHSMAVENDYWSLKPELDICIFSAKGKYASDISASNQAFFEEKARKGIHLALFKMKQAQCPWDLHWDNEELVVLRSVLMKPEHNDPKLWKDVLA